MRAYEGWEPMVLMTVGPPYQGTMTARDLAGVSALLVDLQSQQGLH